MPASFFENCVTSQPAVADRNDLLGVKGLAVAIKTITEAIRSWKSLGSQQNPQLAHMGELWVLLWVLLWS